MAWRNATDSERREMRAAHRQGALPSGWRFNGVTYQCREDEAGHEVAATDSSTIDDHSAAHHDVVDGDDEDEDEDTYG